MDLDFEEHDLLPPGGLSLHDIGFSTGMSSPMAAAAHASPGLVSPTAAGTKAVGEGKEKTSTSRAHSPSTAAVTAAAVTAAAKVLSDAAATSSSTSSSSQQQQKQVNGHGSISSSNGSSTSHGTQGIVPNATINPKDSSRSPSVSAQPSDASSSSGSSKPFIPNVTPTNRSHPAFLNKLQNMVDDPSTDAYICWSPSGRSFFVPNAQKFSLHVLPRFFKHNRFSSFVRQLNMYGFHKVPHLQQGALVKDAGPFQEQPPAKSAQATNGNASKQATVEADEDEDAPPKSKQQSKPSAASTSAEIRTDNGEEQELWEFQHDYFQRGRPDLLHMVQRKKAQPTGRGKTKRGQGNNDDDEEDELEGGKDAWALTLLNQNSPAATLPPLAVSALAAAAAAAASSSSSASGGELVPSGSGNNASLAQFQNFFEAMMSNPAALSAAAAAASKAAGGTDGKDDAAAGVNGNASGNSGSSPFHITTLFSTLQSIQRAQADITRDLHHLRSSHTALWQEALESKNRAKQQEQTMNKLLHFLAGVFGAGGNGSGVNILGETNNDLEMDGASGSIEELIDSFSKNGKNAHSPAMSPLAESVTQAADTSASTSILQPRRRGLMIEARSSDDSSNPRKKRVSTSSASSLDQNRFTEEISPDATLSGARLSPINEASRFTRLGSPSPGTEEQENTLSAGKRRKSSTTKRKGSESDKQQKSKQGSDASNAGGIAARRLSQQQQQQLISAFSTDQASAWLAQLLQQAPSAASSPFAQGSSSAVQTPGQLTPLKGKYDGNAAQALQAMLSGSTSTGSSENNNQLALAMPKSTLELEHSASKAAKVQESISQLVESLKGDPQAAATISSHQGAIAQGIQSLGSVDWGANAQEPSAGLGNDNDMDALLSQFLASDGHSPDASHASPGASGDAAAFAFSPNTTSAFFNHEHQADAAADDFHDGITGNEMEHLTGKITEASPSNSDGQIRTLSPDSSAGSTPAIAGNALPEVEEPSVSPRSKRKASNSGDSAKPAKSSRR